MKSLPRAQPGSGIPLHRTRLPSPKPEPKSNSSSLPRPSTHIPNRTTCSSSPTPISSKDLLRDSTLRNQHLLLRGSTPNHRSSTSSQTHLQDSRSAHSSPQVRRKESSLFRGTLDGSKTESLLDLRSNGNKNFQSGNFRSQTGQIDNGNLRSVISEQLRCHEERVASGSGQSKTGIPSFRFSNKNLRPGPAITNLETGHLRVRRERVSLQNSASSSFSDEEMCTPDDLSPEIPQRPPPETSAMPKQETSSVELLKAKQTPKVNMAAVAPFRYR